MVKERILSLTSWLLVVFLLFSFVLPMNAFALEDAEVEVEATSPVYFTKSGVLKMVEVVDYTQSASGVTSSALSLGNDILSDAAKDEFYKLAEPVLSIMFLDSFKALVTKNIYRDFIEVKDPGLLSLYIEGLGSMVLSNGVSITLDASVKPFLEEVLLKVFISMGENYGITEQSYFNGSVALKDLSVANLYDKSVVYPFTKEMQNLTFAGFGGLYGYYVDEAYAQAQVLLVDEDSSVRNEDYSFVRKSIPIMIPVGCEDFSDFGFSSLNNLVLQVSQEDELNYKVYDPVGKVNPTKTAGYVNQESLNFNVNSLYLLDTGNRIIAVPTVYKEAFSIMLAGVEIKSNISRFIDISNYLTSQKNTSVDVKDHLMNKVGAVDISKFDTGGVFNIAEGKSSLYIYYNEVPTNVLLTFIHDGYIDSFEDNYPGITKEATTVVKARSDYKEVYKELYGSLAVVELICAIFVIGFLGFGLFIGIKSIMRKRKVSKVSGNLFEESTGNLDKDAVSSDSDEQLF